MNRHFVSTAVALVYILFFFVVLHFTLNFAIFYFMQLAFITLVAKEMKCEQFYRLYSHVHCATNNV